MQISSLPIVLPPPSQTQRQDINDRVVKDVQRETTRNTGDDRGSSSLEELQARSEELLQQRVESVDTASNVNNSNSSNVNRQPSNNDDLPLTTQKALQSFADNSPSAEQQLGIELAGVDIFV